MGQTQLVRTVQSHQKKGSVPLGMIHKQSPGLASNVQVRHLGLHEVISNEHMKLKLRVHYVLVSHRMVFINKDYTQSGSAFPSLDVPCAGQTIMDRALRDLHGVFRLQDYEYRSERFVHLGQYQDKVSLSMYVGIPINRYVGGIAPFCNFEWANALMVSKYRFSQNERKVYERMQKERWGI